MSVWKESFPVEIRFLTRNNDLGKVAGNWTWPETGPHAVYLTRLTLRKRAVIILRQFAQCLSYRTSNRHIPVLFSEGVSRSF